MDKQQTKYQDNIFRKLFNTKKNALSLYNILHSTNYTNYDDIELVTLEDIFYNNYKNDLVFLFNKKLIIIIQQSTINENMPLRMLSYISKFYKKLLEDKCISEENLIQMDKYEFFVLYNGTKSLLDENKDKVTEKILKLSDAFVEKNNNQLELLVKVIDIRYNINNRINQNNTLLMNYNYFIYSIEEFRKNNSLREAIIKAIQKCIEKDILKEFKYFLIENSSEVINTLMIEYNAYIEKEVIKQEGIEQGVYETKIEIAQKLLNKGCGLSFISEISGLPVQEVENISKLP